MGETFYFRLSDLVNIIYLFSFVTSLRLVRNNSIPVYMKGFYWYTTLNICIAVLRGLERHFHLIPQELFRITILLSLLFHFAFLSLFISQFYSTKKEKDYFKILFWLFIVSVIIFIIIDIIYHYVIAFGITNTGLFIFCIYYYYQLFRNPPTLNLLRESSFWIITGILFGMSTTIPIFFMGGYLYHNLPRNIFYSIATIAPFGYGIMHLFFIKAFLCSVRPHRK